MQAFPVLDYAFSGTYWIVGHFHYVMAGTTLFALIAGLYYWWPKITKRQYSEKWGVITFIVSFAGFNILYLPYFFMLDMPRRISTYTTTSGLATSNLTATIGAYIFGPAAALAVLNLILSLRKPPTSVSNPWEGRELEWTGDYRGSLAMPNSAAITETSVDPPGNTRSSRWYWCMTGHCTPPNGTSAEAADKSSALRKNSGAEN